jgi:hypothetical protein
VFWDEGLRAKVISQLKVERKPTERSEDEETQNQNQSGREFSAEIWGQKNKRNPHYKRGVPETLDSLGTRFKSGKAFIWS